MTSSTCHQQVNQKLARRPISHVPVFEFDGEAFQDTQSPGAEPFALMTSPALYYSPFSPPGKCTCFPVPASFHTCCIKIHPPKVTKVASFVPRLRLYLLWIKIHPAPKVTNDFCSSHRYRAHPAPSHMTNEEGGGGSARSNTNCAHFLQVCRLRDAKCII